MSEFSGSIEIDGQVAKKDDLTVDCIPDKQVLGISSNDNEKLLSEFNELEKEISTELGQNVSENAQFYETIIQLAIKTGKNPLETMAKIRNNYPICNDFSEIVGEEVSPFGIRMSPSKKPLQSEDWFDFKIEPLIVRATTTYYGNFVFRSANREKVLDALTKSKDYFHNILTKLES